MASSKDILKQFFPPMLATLASDPPPDDANWIYELKYDGFRAVCSVIGGSVTMWSRNQIDLSERFPQIAKALGKLRGHDAVLDAEIVALDEKGTPRFQLLQQGRPEKLFIFDILWLDGEDLRRRSYVDRRSILEKTFRRLPQSIALAEQLEGPGTAALKRIAAGGYEGIIAKRKTSLYEQRRSKEWLKVKALNQQEFAIVGWQPSTHSDREIGSLHLGYVGDDGELRYAGKVGTGFSAKLRTWFRQELEKDVIPKPAVKGAPRIRTATWVRPRLVGQVAFTEWTSDDRLRHPSFLGLRDDKQAEEVVKEKPVVTASTTRVKLTNPDRVLYPRDGYTKQDVADYYAAVSAPMVHALRDRPLALEHWNQGIDKPSWFHQNIGREGPEWLTAIETPTRSSDRRKVKHLVADSPDALRWLAQMSVLTVHMWSSRGANLDEPDWVVFDLDPAKGKGIEQAIEAAIVMRGLLENLELPSVPKTSGKRGIHVLIPLVPGYDHEEANEFACRIAEAVTKQVPTMTVERSLANRRGRLYLDCMQNGYGKTIVAPYSLRAIDGAPVSAPLKWSEVTRRLDPLKFNMKTMPKRLDKVGDLFAPVFETRTKLPRLE